jgi:AcrR family transcriptional regulator
MAPRPANFDRAPSPSDDGLGAVAPRRPPFSDNPQVGARGQRTQQRILDAALRVFGEDGYHQCGVDRITRAAGCSRASFYQYFSGKDDVLGHLVAKVGRQLDAAVEALGPLTADEAGWDALRGWVKSYVEIHRRYEPIFQAFQTAVETDEAITGAAARLGERNVADIHARLATTTLPPRHLDPVIALLLECVPRTIGDAGIVHAAVPDAYPDDVVGDALTDVVHRSLFGLMPGVNVRPPGPPPIPIEFGPAMRDALDRPPEALGLNAAGRRTVQELLEAGRDIFVTRGYHRTRINDIVGAAGLSHGAFYRYFESKDRFAHALAVRAFRRMYGALIEIPAPDTLGGTAGRAALRRWLRRYNATQAAEASMIRVWVDTSLRDDSAAALDWGRRRLSRYLAPRDFGDVEVDAIVMVALLSALGSRQRSPATIDAAVHVIEQGFLGR